MSSVQVKLPPGMPEQMQHLPVDDVGRPIPYFVEYIDGKPDFRVMSAKNFRKAVMEDRCWVCGRRMKPTTPHIFVAGPMCLINGTSAEPPNHRACAEWSARACPFLVNPKKVRREGNLPEEAGESGGIMLDRNPGVTALIEAGWFGIERAGAGYIFKFARVRSVNWLTEGRTATREEVLNSIAGGMGALAEMAASEGPAAVTALAQMAEAAMEWLPAS